MKYETDPRFEAYYLEDSYVLGLEENEPSRLGFSLLLALTPKHPLYVRPSPAEQHCYRNGVLAFEGVTAIDWTDRHFRPISDKAGAIDYGNIDAFEINPRGSYVVKGEWGRVTLKAKRASMTVS